MPITTAEDRASALTHAMVWVAPMVWVDTLTLNSEDLRMAALWTYGGLTLIHPGQPLARVEQPGDVFSRSPVTDISVARVEQPGDVFSRSPVTDTVLRRT